MPDLGEGLVLRAATPGDVDQIVTLSLAAHGDDEEVGLRRLLNDPRVGPQNFTVVTDGDKVVSTLCLAPQALRLSGVDVPAGWVEYVATDPGYRRRGLVKAQMDEVHAWSAERGHLVQIIQGIYYFYRRFGYAYALAGNHRVMLRRGVEPAMPDGWSVRRATPPDLANLARLHEQAAGDVSLFRNADEWELLLGDDPERSPWAVAVHDGAVQGFTRLFQKDGFTWLAEVATASLDAARALLAHGATLGDTHKLAISRRPGTPLEALLDDVGVPFEAGPYVRYARVADPVAFLRHIQPALSARLTASAFAGDRGELRVTTYTGGFSIAYEGGAVTAVEPADPLEEPEDDQVGLPPDLIPQLLLGHHGARELERRHEDISLGDRASLVETLFPPLNHDVWFWF